MAKPRFKYRVPSDEKRINPVYSSIPIQDPKEIVNDVILPWPLKYKPRNLQEIAMHPAKLDEIKTVLDPFSDTRILVLSGPSGSSKSTAVRLIAESRGQNLLEYNAPEASVGSTSLINTFSEFLLGAAMHDRGRTLVLVADLPSIFHENTRAAFEESLLQWSKGPHQPIVAITLTEIEVSAKFSDAIIVPRIFGSLIEGASTSKEVVWIKTNPLSPTILQKQIQFVAIKEGLNCPKSLIKSIAQCGDIRSALNGLEFHSKTLGDSDTQTQCDALGVRGSPTQLFYAIGKVVWTSSKKRSLEESLEGFQDSLENFNLTVLENYTSAKHQRLPILAAAEVTEWLSIADTCSFSKSLGALGAENVISQSNACEKLPRKFVQTRYTQFPKWQSMRFAEQAKVQRSLKNHSLKNNPITKEAYLDLKSFESHFPPMPSTPDFTDSDEDDEF